MWGAPPQKGAVHFILPHVMPSLIGHPKTGLHFAMVLQNLPFAVRPVQRQCVHLKCWASLVMCLSFCHSLRQDLGGQSDVPLLLRSVPAPLPACPDSANCCDGVIKCLQRSASSRRRQMGLRKAGTNPVCSSVKISRCCSVGQACYQDVTWLKRSQWYSDVLIRNVKKEPRVTEFPFTKAGLPPAISHSPSWAGIPCCWYF